jgi:hypothetical protein
LKADFMGEHELTFDQHEGFAELCALYSTGTLSEAELDGLRKHLNECRECRARIASYSQVVRDGLPWLAEEAVPEEDSSNLFFSPAAAKQALYAELDSRAWRIADVSVRPPLQASTRRRKIGLIGSPFAPFSLAWMLATIIVLVLAVGLALAFWRPSNSFFWKDDGASGTGHAVINPDFAPLVKERDTLSAALRERDEKVQVLTAQIDGHVKEISRLRAIAEGYRAESNQVKSQLSAVRDEQDAMKNNRESLETQLNQTQDSLVTLQKELKNLQSERRGDLLHSASLETKLAQLSAQLAEQHTTMVAQKSTIDEQESMLGSDRDIRELMGARNLYIADVFDVDPNSHTEKSFGRVFYTKNKSLIFYAFDLDQQHGMKNASAFQAWGLRDVDKKHPLNLGIFYLDNQANRRWVLKFEDPTVLAKINSVFVTIEPQGGSTKPSGKQLLYAYLSNQPNHP